MRNDKYVVNDRNYLAFLFYVILAVLLLDYRKGVAEWHDRKTDFSDVFFAAPLSKNLVRDRLLSPNDYSDVFIAAPISKNLINDLSDINLIPQTASPPGDGPLFGQGQEGAHDRPGNGCWEESDCDAGETCVKASGRKYGFCQDTGFPRGTVQSDPRECVGGSPSDGNRAVSYTHLTLPTKKIE